MGWRILEPLPTTERFRSLDSATCTEQVGADGRYERTLAHAPLPGITPAMVLWYLERVDTMIAWEGREVLAYRLWHPRDHIYFKRKGKFGPGDRWHIVEAFGANPKFLMQGVFRVTRLDDTGFTMESGPLGMPVARMEERWTMGPKGLEWTIVQSFSPRLGALLRRVKRDMLAAWPKHNVEEVGRLPEFLPALYETRVRG